MGAVIFINVVVYLLADRRSSFSKQVSIPHVRLFVINLVALSCTQNICDRIAQLLGLLRWPFSHVIAPQD